MKILNYTELLLKQQKYNKANNMNPFYYEFIKKY